MSSSKTGIVLRVLLDLILLITAFVPYLITKIGVFPFKRGFYCNDESLSHPYHSTTISSMLVRLLGLGVNILAILIIERMIHSCRQRKGTVREGYKFGQWRVAHFVVAYYCLILALLFGEAVHDSLLYTIKHMVGRLRPHFFAVCQPDWSRINCTDQQGHSRYITEDVCTGTDEHRLEDMRMSFPSGHSSMAFYYATFFTIYIESRVRGRCGRLLVHFLCILALYGAMVVALSRISDYKHHWSDVLAGILMGIIIGILTAIRVGNMLRERKIQEPEQQNGLPKPNLCTQVSKC